MIPDTPEQFERLKRECINQVRHYVELAAQKLGVRINFPVVKFCLKGRTAGQAWYGKNEIFFNPTLLRENPEHFLKQTVGHEVAHLVARKKYGLHISSHGKEWAAVMWTFGLMATRCHFYDTSNVPTQIGKRVVTRQPIQFSVAGGMARAVSVGKVIEFD